MSRYDGHTSDETGEAATGKKPTLPGIDPGADLQPDPAVLTDGIPYVSKSRITEFIKCPAKFYWKYICGHRTPGSYHTEKGGRLHVAFEEYHLNLMEYVEEHGEKPLLWSDLLPDWKNWAQWIEQWGAFMKFEERRWREAVDHAHAVAALDWWLPVAVEAELWLGEPPESWFENDHVDGDPDYIGSEPPLGEAPWMGRADLIVHTESMPGVEGTGVVIIDYKTGSCPTIRYANDPNLPQYLNEGIFLEGEYYGWLAELCDDFPYEVDAVAGYYPAHDELVVSPFPNKGRRRDLKRCVLGMQKTPEYVQGNGPPDNFGHEPQPLCNYGSGNCYFFNICKSTWGL